MWRVEVFFHRLINHWEHASSTDFGAIALTICVAVWFIARYCD